MNRDHLSLGSWPLLLGLGVALVVLWIMPAGALSAECPNEAVRTGASANLPDCRAYELVTPPDTNGRLIEAISTFGLSSFTDMFPTELGSPTRDSFLYLTYNGPLPSSEEASGTFDIYQAVRSEGGWETGRRLNPPGDQAVLPYPGGISRDHRYTFTNVSPFLNGTHPGGSLAAQGISDYLNAPDGSLELTGIGSLGHERLAQGRYISEGGEHVIFVTGKAQGPGDVQSVWCINGGEPCPVQQLEPNAAPTGTGAIYDRRADGETRVISLLPGDVPAGAGEEAFYQGVSEDGSVVAFKVGGTLYVRIDNEGTLEVTEDAAAYAGLSRDGRYLFYVVGGDIHRFDTGTSEDEQVNSTGDGEVVNVSSDGSHVYFVSKSQLGGKGVVGEPNMYVWSDGQEPEFVATVDPADLQGLPSLTNWTSWVVSPRATVEAFGGPGGNLSRSTPNGSVLAFGSRAQLTSYDNGGHLEIYRYDEDDKSLVCVSCNPLAEPASADARFQFLDLVNSAMVIHNLSADGSRVFFETPEALVTQDVDEINDIYQWHLEEGEPSIDLISSGQSVEYPPLLFLPTYVPTPNILFSITPDGEDVYFLTLDELVPRAGGGGIQAIYNARINGGFAEPVPAPKCVEDGCSRPLPVAPSLLGPVPSETTKGAGNVKPRKRKAKHCQRAKHKKHKHCKKKKASQRQTRIGVLPTGGSTRGSASATSISESTSASDTAITLPSDSGGGTTSAVQALADPEFDFEIKEFVAEESSTAAGAHPDFTTRFAVSSFINKSTGRPETDARLQEASVFLPSGLLGNVNAIPMCKTGELVGGIGNCPIKSQVGLAEVTVSGFGRLPEPIYNLEPPHPDKEIARFGFIGHSFPVFIDVKVRTAGDYGVTAIVRNSPGQAALLKAKTTLWGNPADPMHDPQRLRADEAGDCASTSTACKTPDGKRPSELPPTAFLTNPSACQPMEVGLTTKSYQLPGQIFTATASMDPITDCTDLPFDPAFEAEATNPTAGAPTGLKTTLTIPQQSTEAVDSPATATMKEARVTLPTGMAIAAGAANGIASCSEEQVGYKQEVDVACPDASKVGVATIVSPLLPHPIQGELYLRTPAPGRQFGLWLTSDELGLHVKIPGEIEPDKQRERVTAVFKDLPQTPVSQIDLNIWGGPKAPLTAPELCGTYTTDWSFKPHSNDPAVTGQSQITITQGCGERGFSPKLQAGTTNARAGAFSPFVFDLERGDSDQNLASLDIKLPDGLLAELKGVGLCPEADAASGACPANSQIGHLSAAIGGGPFPLSIPQPGKAKTAVYLAGPYKAAPFSLIAVVPAQAGPFDLGNVVVRSALYIDPETARAAVVSDPLPQFFEGVGVIYRRLHVVIDRPNFTLNPTDCSELAIGSHLTSVRGAITKPSVRFAVDGCRSLRYGPKLKLTFKGGTKRSGHPAVKATLTQPPGQANTAKATVLLPFNMFIDQDHINSPCTRVQFREDECPKLSILGRAVAVTPLLDEPLKGPVYFRSNGGERELPDIVADLRGQIHITLVGFVDAVPVKGTERSRIRTRFAKVPDAPVTKFTMSLLGGRKRGLLENSRNLCKTSRRAKTSLTAQNGRQSTRNQQIKTSCGSRGK